MKNTKRNISMIVGAAIIGNQLPRLVSAIDSLKKITTNTDLPQTEDISIIPQVGLATASIVSLAVLTALHA